jgi:uncharacterized protein YceK
MKKIILSLIIVLTMSGCYVTIQERPYTRSSETYIRHGYHARPHQCNFQREYYNAHKHYINY